MDPPEGWLTDLMNAPEVGINPFQVQPIQDSYVQDATAMSSHYPGQYGSLSFVQDATAMLSYDPGQHGSLSFVQYTQQPASKAVTSTQQPASKAVTIMSKRPPGACFQSLVTVEVGDEKKQFVIHKDLLTFYSDFFRGAFNGAFIEAAKGKLSLVDEDVEIFDIFHKFLYTGCLADGNGHNLYTGQLVKLWLFGDKFIIPCLQNSAIDALSKRLRIRHTVPTGHIKRIWKNTMPSAPLRKFMLDVVVYTSNVDEVLSSEHEQPWTREALIDLVKAVSNKQSVEQVGEYYTIPKRHKCYYHIHAEGEKCE